MQFRGGRLLPMFLIVLGGSLPTASAQESSGLVFRSSVDMVSVSAVVRDRRGRVVSSLTRDDFQVIDAGEQRRIVDLLSDEQAPASLALLVDGSGSMRLSNALETSRQISAAVLSSLNPERDDAALMTFDTRLVTLCGFTRDFGRVRRSLDDLEAFGSTSLYDAIAGSAGIVAERTHNRRAVVVLTDGADNTSTYSPEVVSAIASTIDVPVYVFALGGSAENVKISKITGRPEGALSELALATGGDYFVANTPALVNAGIRRLVEELRHQYVIAFEAGRANGLRPIQIRTRQSELKVRSRSHYAGTSE